MTKYVCYETPREYVEKLQAAYKPPEDVRDYWSVRKAGNGFPIMERPDGTFAPEFRLMFWACPDTENSPQEPRPGELELMLQRWIEYGPLK